MKKIFLLELSISMYRNKWLFICPLSLFDKHLRKVSNRTIKNKNTLKKIAKQKMKRRAEK